jgi:hypothetical protein
MDTVLLLLSLLSTPTPPAQVERAPDSQVSAVQNVTKEIEIKTKKIEIKVPAGHCDNVHSRCWFYPN